MDDVEVFRARGQTIETLVSSLASPAPVPGGGSAAAVAAALGAGLVQMVAALSEGRPAYEEHRHTHQRASDASAELASRLLALADADAAAYAEFAAAMRLPRATDDERSMRATAMRAAARTASDVPMRTLEACRDLAAAAEALAGRSNRNAASDLGVATRLAEAAAHGAAANVRVNLPSLGDAATADRLEMRVAEMLAEVEELAETARAYLEAGEPRPPEEPVDG